MAQGSAWPKREEAHACSVCAHPYHSTQVPVSVTIAGAWTHLGVLIDARLVADVARALRVAQRAQRLLVAPVRRADVGDHDRLSVAAEAVLKQPRQLAVPVRDVACMQQSPGVRVILRLLAAQVLALLLAASDDDAMNKSTEIQTTVCAMLIR